MNPYIELLNSRNPKDYFGPKEMAKELCRLARAPQRSLVCVLGLPGTGKSALVSYMASETSRQPGEGPQLFPILVEYRTLPTDTDPVSYLCQRYFEEWKNGKDRLKLPSHSSPPALPDGAEDSAGCDLKTDVKLVDWHSRWLDSHGVRSLFLLDDFDIPLEPGPVDLGGSKKHVFKIDTLNQLRPWRQNVAYVLTASRVLRDVNPVVFGGSTFFGFTDYHDMLPLSEMEAENLLTRPVKIRFPEVKKLIELAGPLACCLIKAGMALREVRDRFHVKAEHSLNKAQWELVINLLKRDLRPIFDRFMLELSPEQKSVWEALATAGVLHISEDTPLVQLDFLRRKCLAKQVKDRYEIATGLFRDFVIPPALNELTGMEQSLYAYFRQNPGRIIPVPELLREVWNTETDQRKGWHKVQVVTSRLRIYLKVNTSETIQSIKGQGYIFTKTGQQ